jgi:murein L,D-transpeptidase YcbB/YkuD
VVHAPSAKALHTILCVVVTLCVELGAMRKQSFERLLAGTMLAAIVATPAISIAAPDRVQSVGPMPPSLNGQPPRHRDAAPVPPPPAGYMPPAVQRSTPASDSRAQVTGPEPVAQAAPPAPAEPDTSAAAETNSALDKQLAASDAAISDKLRDIAKQQMARRIEREPERKAAEQFYAQRNYAPLWIRDGHLTPQAKAAIAHLKDAAADALDAPDYPVPEFTSLTSAEQLADADIKMTNSVLTYARHLAVGRIAPTRVSAEVDYGNHTPEPADILKKLADARDMNATLENFNPPNEGFRALKAKLAELRSNAPRAEAPDNRIPDGRRINPGDKDSRVPALRQKLGLKNKADDLVYDKALWNAIRNVQAKADIKPTGIIDSKTIATINGPKPLSANQQIMHVVATMEHWRWLPRDLGKTYVMVNIPDYTLKVVRDNKVEWRTKIVAGKPQTPTPLLTAPMQEVIVNPSWYVPQSIIQNELLPQYASDPQIFDRMGLEVKRGPDGHINVVQPPGAANALGRIKFSFPNKFQVYLHDTPEKRLFAPEKRAFSHGCMRVENPTKFGEVMLSLAMSGPTPTSHTLDQMFGKDEKIYKLMQRPMVHLTYQTAFVEDGKLVVLDDIYGFDARINAIMHSDERRVADVAPPKDPKRDAVNERSNQDILSRVERREAQNPFSFFDRLFR